MTNRKPPNTMCTRSDDCIAKHVLPTDSAVDAEPHKDTGEDNSPANLAEAIRARFAPLGDIELEIPPRQPMREPPDFD